MPETAKKFYLTTPIYYVNARPHIGHAYTTIAADVIARRHRLLGDDTFFLTGTDEHGQKVQRASLAAGVSPQEYADQVSASFQNLWKRMGITNDDFLRTTEARHKKGVQKLWTLLEARGAIYLSSYTGQYCVSEEMFVDGPPGTIGPDGKPTETVTEENYFFRLSDYQLSLIDLIESGQLHIQPDTARNEVLSFLRGGLKDLSISRTSFTWGIPVPEAPGTSGPTGHHVVYVWLDALANYITAIGYGSDDPAEQAKFARYWPADLHLVGKEITRFHCVYWPAFLLAARLPLPKSIVANGWLLFEESKMSKSRGNVVRTETILDAFGPLCPPIAPSPSGGSRGLQPPESTPLEGGALAPGLAPPTKAQQDLFAADVLRYFLLREIPFGQDGSFSFDALITRYNADLANGYGNLVSRTLSMMNKYTFGEVPAPHDHKFIQEFIYDAQSDNISDADGFLDFLVALSSHSGYSPETDPFQLGRELRNVWKLIGLTDGQVTSSAPWKIYANEDLGSKQELHRILYETSEVVRICAAILYSIAPYATASVWRQLGLGDIEEAARNGELKDLKWGGLKPGTKLGPLAPIFPRADKGLAQIMTEMESPSTPTPTSSESSSAPNTATVESVSSVHSAAGLASAASSAAPASTDHLPLTTDHSPQISIDDFTKVDLRVAQIVVAERIPKADKLLRLEVDLGPNFNPSRRQILAGIAEYYAPETLIGRKVVIVSNLAPRKMRGLESQGMIVAASIGPAGAPILAGFLEDVELGARLK